jgi:hypothetical protein
MGKYLAESDIETAAIEWLLEDKRFRYHYGPDIHRSHKKAVLENVFSNYLKERYKHVPAKILAEVHQEFLFQPAPICIYAIMRFTLNSARVLIRHERCKWQRLL